MKFFSRPRERPQDENKETVLFVYVENAGRSQIAEGFFRKYAPKNYEPLSAGTSPSSTVILSRHR